MRFLLIFGVLFSLIADAAIVSRSKLDHPALGTSGGAALHASIEAIFTTLGDNSNGRYEEFSAIANATTVEVDHNFGVAIAELRVLIYTGSGTNLTRVQDPAASGWAIAAKVGSEKLVTEVTTPGSGGPHTFAVVIAHGTFIENLSELDDVLVSAPANGEILIYNSGNSRFENGANTVSPWTPTSQTSNYTAIDRNEVHCDTASVGAFQVDLPASPSLGTRVRVIDAVGNFNTATLTVSGNGNNIMGNSTYTISTDWEMREFVYNGTEYVAI